MSTQTVKHTAQENALLKRLVRELGPKTPLAKATMAEWKADASRARHAKPKASREAGITEIPLEQLDKSPYQLRHDMD
jgi:hypothetical protein